MLVSNLFATVPETKPTAAQEALVSPPAPAQPLSVADHQLATITQLTSVATAAIHTAESSVENMHKFFTGLATLITAIAALLAFLGVKNIRELQGIREGADKTVAKLKELEVEADGVLAGLKTQVSLTQEQMSESAFTMISCQEALRGLYLVQTMPFTEDEKKEQLEDSISYLTDAIESLKKSENMNIRLLAWGYSMRAYIRKFLGESSSAIEDEEVAVQIADDFIKKTKPLTLETNFWERRPAEELEKRLPTKFYNLACYYSLQNNNDKSLWYLDLAVTADATFKADARNDSDFKCLFDNSDFQRVTS